MTGYSPDHLRQNIMETISASDYNEYGQHYLPLEWEGAEEYSKPLRDLVRHCLDPSAALRSTPDQILQSTATALEYWSGKVATADPAQKRRYGLYFRHGERSDVPVGTKQTLPDASHVERRALFLGVRYDDPEHPVRLPYELWEDIYDDPYMYMFDPYARQMTVNMDGKLDFGDENMVEPHNYGVHLGLEETQENKDEDQDDEDDMLFHRFDENGVIDRGDDNEDDDQNADQDGEQRGGSGDDLGVSPRHRLPLPEPPESMFENAVKEEEGDDQDGEQRDGSEDDPDVSQRHRSPSPEPPENVFEDSNEEEEDTVETLSQLSIAELRGRVRALDIQGAKLSGKGVDKPCLAQASVNHRQGLGLPRAMLKGDAKKGKERG